MATEAPAALEASQVQAFVGNAHGDLEAVRAALEAEPGLVNAAWDWGGGDWETPLGAASHMLRRDIAELLLAHGARHFRLRQRKALRRATCARPRGSRRPRARRLPSRR